MDDLSPEQQRQFDADYADFWRQLARTAVDLRAASPDMHEIEAPRHGDSKTSEDGVESYTTELTIDFSGILETLRRLPAGAGTSAFVVAYNSTHRDWRGQSSEKR